MKITTLVTILGAAALLSDCGGGGGGTAPSPSILSSTTNATGVATGLAVRVDTGALKSSSKRRSPQQITADVAGVIIFIDNDGGTRYSFSPMSPACSGSSPNYTCSISASPGSHTVDVWTEGDPPPIVGFSVPQYNVAVSLGQVTPLTFTLTPVAASFSGSTTTPPAGGSLPEDGADHSVWFTLDVLALDGEAISQPIDTANLFGTVAVSTVPFYNVGQAPQAAPNAITGSYTDTQYYFTRFGYDGAQISGDELAVQAAYTENLNAAPAGAVAVAAQYNLTVTAPSVPTTVFSIPLTRLTLPTDPYPTGATLGGTTYDPTNSYYYYPPNNSGVPTVPQPNNSNTGVLVYSSTADEKFFLAVTETNDTSQVNFTGSCATANGSGGPIWLPGWAAFGAPNAVTNLLIQPPPTTGQTAPCVLTVVDGQFPTLTQSITVYPSAGSYAISTQSLHRVK